MIGYNEIGHHLVRPREWIVREHDSDAGGGVDLGGVNHGEHLHQITVTLYTIIIVKVDSYISSYTAPEARPGQFGQCRRPCH